MRRSRGLLYCDGMGMCQVVCVGLAMEMTGDVVLGQHALAVKELMVQERCGAVIARVLFGLMSTFYRKLSPLKNDFK